MATKEIHYIPPSNSPLGMWLLIADVALLVLVAVLFVVRYFTAGGPDWLLGVFLSAEFFLMGVGILIYTRFFVPYREVSEDREDELLW
jgi:hypothetical protein